MTAETQLLPKGDTLIAELKEVSLLDWLEPVLSRFREIVDLPAGWAEDDSPIPTAELVVECLQQLLMFMPHHAHPPFVLPLYNGGIQLEWHSGGWDIDVEFTPGAAAEYSGEEHLTGKTINGLICDHRQPLTDAVKVLTERHSAE